MSEPEISFGPCCFCAQTIQQSDVDPCRLTINTHGNKWQVWFCHAACFKVRLKDPPDEPGFFDPAHF
jgi:hypothetical protein